LASDAPVEMVLLRASGIEIGQVLLVESGATTRIREPGDRTTRGLWNLNFYVDDIRQTTVALRRLGFAPWSDPVEHAMGGDTGAAIEVLFEAPDGVAINLVQPLGGPETFTGRIRSPRPRNACSRWIWPRASMWPCWVSKPCSMKSSASRRSIISTAVRRGRSAIPCS
jgi:hypothetical protein